MKKLTLRENKSLINVFEKMLRTEKDAFVQNHYREIISHLRILNYQLYKAPCYSTREYLEKGWI